MITEDYVSFETAKLLREKGFNGECFSMYLTPKPHSGMGDPNEAKIAPHGRDSYYYEGYKYQCEAPTLQMAMKWLREVHNQHIVVEAYNYMARLRTDYYVEIQNLNEPTAKNFCVNGCMRKRTYEEACEAAIKYCLENLILKL